MAITISLRCHLISATLDSRDDSWKMMRNQMEYTYTEAGQRRRHVCNQFFMSKVRCCRLQQQQQRSELSTVVTGVGSVRREKRTICEFLWTKNISTPNRFKFCPFIALASATRLRMSVILAFYCLLLKMPSVYDSLFAVLANRIRYFQLT